MRQHPRCPRRPRRRQQCLFLAYRSRNSGRAKDSVPRKAWRQGLRLERRDKEAWLLAAWFENLLSFSQQGEQKSKRRNDSGRLCIEPRVRVGELPRQTERSLIANFRIFIKPGVLHRSRMKFFPKKVYHDRREFSRVKVDNPINVIRLRSLREVL